MNFMIMLLCFILSTGMMCNAICATKSSSVISMIYGFFFAAGFVGMIYFLIDEKCRKGNRRN